MSLDPRLRKPALIAAAVLLGSVAVAVGLREPARTTTLDEGDLAAQLAAVHAKARAGELKFVAPKRLVDAFLEAGFAAHRPAPDLSPMATLAGGAVVYLSGQGATLAHYRNNQGELSVVSWPEESLGLPATAAPLVWQGERYSVLRDKSARIFAYRHGGWFVAVVTDAPESEAPRIAELVRRAQAR